MFMSEKAVRAMAVVNPNFIAVQRTLWEAARNARLVASDAEATLAVADGNLGSCSIGAATTTRQTFPRRTSPPLATPSPQTPMRKSKTWETAVSPVPYVGQFVFHFLHFFAGDCNFTSRGSRPRAAEHGRGEQHELEEHARFILG